MSTGLTEHNPTSTYHKKPIHIHTISFNINTAWMQYSNSWIYNSIPHWAYIIPILSFIAQHCA